MNEQTGERYSFCPVCGTLMEDGICPECTRKKELQGVYSSGGLQQSAHQQSNVYQQNVCDRQQGGYYGQSRQNSMYREYNPYMKPQKDNKVWLIIGIVVAVLVLLVSIVGSFFYGYFIMKLAEEDTELFSEEYEFSDDYEDEEALGEDYLYEPEEDYEPSPEDEYYSGPCDCINKDVDYSFINKTYTNEDEENDIDIVINYLELRGEGIPNVDQLNETLESEALYYVEDFVKDSVYAEYGESYSVYITTYVTYNDDNLVSLVLDEYVAMDDYYHIDLFPINIDIKNGVILDNDSILQIDEAFAKEFRKRNNQQNGNIEYLDSLTDAELAEQLKDEHFMIAYYTPLGMEVGMNYSTDTSGGWLTVTYKDYEEYLAKF